MSEYDANTLFLEQQPIKISELDQNKTILDEMAEEFIKGHHQLQNDHIGFITQALQREGKAKQKVEEAAAHFLPLRKPQPGFSKDLLSK